MSASEDFSLNNLTDELLIEILRRHPTAKSVLAGCILVCKRWHSLIFSSYFVSQFDEHHRNQNKNSYYPAYQNPPTVLIRPILYSGRCGNGLFVVTDGEDAIFDSPEYALEFLPVKDIFHIVASCNDLLLCRFIAYSHPVYYVCNYLTRRWFFLPPTAAIFAKNSSYQAKSGLVYDSNYRTMEREKYEPRFRVLGIKDDSMHVYCSETSRWNELPVSGEEHRPCLSNVAAFDCKLYWCNGRDVVAYDPFSNETTFIDGSDDEELSKEDRSVGLRLGICQGALCLMRLENDSNYLENADCRLSIWEIKDYGSISDY